MKALVYRGSENVAVEDVPYPKIQEGTDIILRVTTAAICGSDLHLYGGLVPTMEKGDILGHEFMGEVAEVGPQVQNIKPGERVVIPFPISCGQCEYCKAGLWALCDTTNRDNEMAQKMFGYPPAGIYGYSHLFGGYSGGQAEFVRVPYADVNAFKIPAEISDEQVLFLGDILPTGYMAAENCGIKKGDTVAVWGAGPVGQFAVMSAFLLGAGKVIAIDSYEERLEMARKHGAETVNDEEVKGLDVFAQLKDMTGGRGPDAAIDAAGMEAHGTGVLPGMMEMVEQAKQAVLPGMDRGNALRETIYGVRKGGTVSVAGAYAGFVDKFPMGIAFNKGLTLKMGQTHVQRYMVKLFEHIRNGKIDPSSIITHRFTLDQAPKAYEMFRNKEDGCIKVVLKT